MSFFLIAESVIGSSHKKIGINQDAYKIRKMGDMIIIAVADGHGSSKCKFSDIGAQKAVKSFFDCMIDYSKQFADPVNFHIFLSRNKEDFIPKRICENWNRKVKNYHTKNIHNEKFDPILYGTTLLGIIVCRNFVCAFQIGDGDIICVEKDGNTTRLIEGRKILGTETNSLSSENAWKNVIMKTKYYNLLEEMPSLIFLSTDGMSNSFISDDAFMSIGDDYLGLIKQHGISIVKNNLGNWLKETTENGSGDDITIAIAVNDFLISEHNESK